MEKTFAYGINQKVYCPMISKLDHLEANTIYKVVRKHEYAKEDYTIERIKDKCQYPAFEFELRALPIAKKPKHKKDREEVPTPRQWWLYHTLEAMNLKDETKRMPVNAVIREFENDLSRGDIEEYPKNKSAAERSIKADIQHLIECPIISKIIISSSLGYKIATREEAKLYKERQIIFILGEFKRYHMQVRRLSRDGQCRIKLSKYQKELFQTFLGGNE